MKTGDKVSWTYRHNLNSRSYTYKTKTGFIKSIKGDFSKVHFKGNIYPSKVLTRELKQKE